MKLRAREAPREATVQTVAGVTTVTLDEPALPAPGQACVFYAGDRVLGGGIMTRPETQEPLLSRYGRRTPIIQVKPAVNFAS